MTIVIICWVVFCLLFTWANIDARICSDKMKEISARQLNALMGRRDYKSDVAIREQLVSELEKTFTRQIIFGSLATISFIVACLFSLLWIVGKI